MVIFIYDQLYLKNIEELKQDFILIKAAIHQEEIITVNIYVPNVGILI
jgi:hypothetical protein